MDNTVKQYNRKKSIILIVFTTILMIATALTGVHLNMNPLPIILCVLGVMLLVLILTPDSYVKAISNIKD